MRPAETATDTTTHGQIYTSYGNGILTLSSRIRTTDDTRHEGFLLNV